MQRRVAARGIVVNDNGEVFAMRFRMDDGSESDYWGTPGGGLDDHEPLVEGLKREFLEETGIEATVGKLLFIQQFPSLKDGSTQEQLELFFHVKNTADFEKRIDLATTSHGALELTRAEFIDPKTNLLLPRFLQTIDIVDYIKNDRPVFIANYL